MAKIQQCSEDENMPKCRKHLKREQARRRRRLERADPEHAPPKLPFWGYSMFGINWG